MLISFTNALGETFDIQDNYMLQPTWDLNNAPVKHQSSKAPYQDGETYIDTIFESGSPIIEFAITGVNRQEIFDRRLIVQRYFNPKLGIGTLTLVQDDGITTYCLDCIPSLPIFPSGDGRSNNHQMVIIQFFAPNPFWYDPARLQQIMIGFSGGFSFPFSFPFNLGTVGSEIEVINSGNIETPVMIYFYGEVVDPVISNLTTDEEITIVKTVNDGEILIINTAFGEKAALILSGGVYTNAFEYVDPNSIFWKLAPGSNTVKYTVTSEGANAQCRLYYYNLYSGL
jgi:hypothetical protein